MKSFVLCAFTALLLICSKANGQQLDVALNNPVIMKYYTVEQLTEIAQRDTMELNSIVYYFTQSFSIETIECSECLPFDPATFDIMQFEHLRQRDSAYTREFDKYGFKLTLYPIEALPYKYEIHSVPQIDPGDNNQQEQR